MQLFEEIASKNVIYKLKTSWLHIEKLYNELAAEHGVSLSMAFVLIAINEEEGTPVTKIAPRIGMEPNSLSRIINVLEEKKYICRKRDKLDKRKVYIQLTTEGALKREIALKAVFRLEKSITSSLSREELKGFFAVANHIPEAIKTFKESE